MNTPAPTSLALPRLGAHWPGQGGLFAGLCRGEDGQPDYALICADTGGKAAYAAALKLATAYTADGHQDFATPTRREATLCYANCQDGFKREWYWTGVQHAGGPDWAWFQSFSYGVQYHLHKSNQCRVFAVRRLTIRSLVDSITRT